MTQMKAYLCQSSELDPPIESLIPEDVIGKAFILLDVFESIVTSKDPFVVVKGIAHRVFSTQACEWWLKYHFSMMWDNTVSFGE